MQPPAISNPVASIGAVPYEKNSARPAIAPPATPAEKPASVRRRLSDEQQGKRRGDQERLQLIE